MFYKRLLPDEEPIMNEFIKYKCHCIISVIEKDGNGLVKRV